MPDLPTDDPLQHAPTPPPTWRIAGIPIALGVLYAALALGTFLGFGLDGNTIVYLLLGSSSPGTGRAACAPLPIPNAACARTSSC